MNSKQLKKSHRATYESFFEKHQIVTSAPFLMTWAGDPSKYYSGITIKQKIPLRLYLGIAPSNSGKIRFNTITYFDKTSDAFASADLLEYAPHFHQLNEYVHQHRKAILDRYEGIDINILSELPRGVGLGFESIVSSLVSTVFHRLSGHIDSDSLESVQKLTLEEALKTSDTQILRRLGDSISMDRLMFGEIISGVKRSSFFDSYYPIVTMAEDYDNMYDDVSFSLAKSYSFRLDELFTQLKSVPSLPLDYGIIYSGKPILLEQIVSKDHYTSSYLNDIKPKLKKLFAPHFAHLPSKEVPKFYKDFICVDNEGPEQCAYGKIMELASINTLYSMAQLYCNSYNEKYIALFIDTLKKFRRVDYITREGLSEFIEIVKDLTENCKMPSKILGLFPNDTCIMGGTIGFAIPLEGYRKHILSSIEDTKKAFSGVDLIYCSRLDGLESKGLQFEQDIEKGVFSEFIDGEKHTFINTDGVHILGSYNELMAIKGQDILLDCTNNKLYVNDKKVTSEELHSQTTTIDVLQTLMKHIGKDVHNKQLPSSSYSKNKNTMLSKIVIPFLKLTKKELNKDFPLICKGMLYDFHMKLGSSNIKIGVVDKIHHAR